MSGLEKEQLKIALNDDGIHLLDSILWFDAQHSGELSFLSSALNSTKSLTPKVITTEETIKILGYSHLKINALVCQYNRPFSLGKLRLELLPSGSLLGGASLFVEKDASTLLYAPIIQTEKISCLRTAQLKPADTLIMNAHYPEHFARGKSRKKEKERLLSTVQEMIAQKSYPAIFCHSIGTAQELTSLLTQENIPVNTHRQIYKINQLYEAYGSRLGSFSLLSNRKGKNKVTIMPRDFISLRKYDSEFRDRPILLVEDACDITEGSQDTQTAHTQTFFLNRLSGLDDLKETLEIVKPQEVYFFGPYAIRYSQKIRHLVPKAKVLYAHDQPPLL
jgi:hypothetical protein